MIQLWSKLFAGISYWRCQAKWHLVAGMNITINATQSKVEYPAYDTDAFKNQGFYIML